MDVYYVAQTLIPHKNKDTQKHIFIYYIIINYIN